MSSRWKARYAKKRCTPCAGQTQRMEGLVKQLLTLSKIEAAPTHLLNEKVDVPMMLRVVEREAGLWSQKTDIYL